MRDLLQGMKFHALFASRFLQARLVYRAALWIDLAFSLLFLMMQVFLWRALIGGGAASGATFQDMVSYVVIGAVIGVVAYSGAEWKIQARLESGDIAHDLARPMSFRLQMFLSDLGNSASGLLLTALPTLAVAIAFLGMKGPASAAAFAAFVLLALGGLAIAFYTSYLIGLIAFYVLRVDYLSMAVHSLISFLSGQFAPLWFYPGWLRTVADYSPFTYIYYTPIAVYLGKIPLSDVGRSIAVMAAWVLLFAGAEWALWRRTMKRLVVQGG